MVRGSQKSDQHHEENRERPGHARCYVEPPREFRHSPESMADKPIKYRPFRGLSSLSAKPRNPGSSFSDVMAREGTVPLRAGTRRIAPERKSRPAASVSAAPTFEVTRDDDWLEGQRTGLSVELRRRLHGTPT